jgi:hypothetical protein
MCVICHGGGYTSASEQTATTRRGSAMRSDAADPDAGRGIAKRDVDDLEQIPDEVWARFVQILRDRVREEQASEEARAEFVQMLLEKVREDPYPSRDQLDLLERSLPPEMVADYARVLMEKAGGEPFPSSDVLRRIQRMTDGGSFN